ncbi:MAG TPA: class II fructose-bisphosphate aldolase, partial [Anaerolineales bacterium]|nr:class II fructose-bisphosphate aldolase [Anaerolineales bacterium]
MSVQQALQRVVEPFGDAFRLGPGPSVKVVSRDNLSRQMDRLARIAALGAAPEANLARWVIRSAAADVGIHPASIDALYRARGRGETRTNFTVPAMNLRALAYHSARAVFRAARAVEAKAIIFEIARSEMGYTAQRPSEYSSSVLAAAIVEGHTGPVFIQGDHFQMSPKRFGEDPAKEVDAVRALVAESLEAGFFNIDIDTSTLVDLSKASLEAQQELNVQMCAELALEVRRLEPKGLTVSIGGEIGEVGGRNSTEEELRAFMDGFNRVFGRLRPGAPGLSKISIQTGTSHGGVVLPDGSIADVKVDFDTLRKLSEVARTAYGLAGAVQHGASTLPEQAFSRFAEAAACEVHLATNFQTMLFDRLPDGVRREMYAFLDRDFAGERKADMTDEQFYYKVRKNALGPFKKTLWELPGDVLDDVGRAWEDQFRLLFERLGVVGTRAEVERHIES